VTNLWRDVEDNVNILAFTKKMPGLETNGGCRWLTQMHLNKGSEWHINTV